MARAVAAREVVLRNWRRSVLGRAAGFSVGFDTGKGYTSRADAGLRGDRLLAWISD
jgi:hypothetical protein